MTRRQFVVSGIAGLLLLAGGALSAGAAPANPVATPGAGPVAVAQGMGPRWGSGWSAPAAVEKLLGIDDAQIRADRQAGQSLVEIAKAKNVDEATLIQTIVDSRQAQVDQLVKDGKLSQEQANLMLERMQTQVKAAVERTTVGPLGPADGTRLGLGPGQGRGLQSQSGPANAQPGNGPRMGGFGLGLHR